MKLSLDTPDWWSEFPQHKLVGKGCITPSSVERIDLSWPTEEAPPAWCSLDSHELRGWKIVAGALTDQTNRFYVDSVQRPFEKQDIGPAWVADRNKYIKATAIGQTSKEIQTARATSVQMRKTWEKILSGVYDTSEMRQQIAELEALVSAMAVVKQVEKPKATAP